MPREFTLFRIWRDFDEHSHRKMLANRKQYFFPFLGRVPPAWAQWRRSVARAIDGVV